MSYSDPAPFADLLFIAERIKSSVEALQKHPDGVKAFEAWMRDVNFRERYGTRHKDLPVDDHVPEALVLVTDSFSVDEVGELWSESRHSQMMWDGDKWIDSDGLDEDVG